MNTIYKEGTIAQMKFSEEELLRIADSGLADMSCEQIKQLIQKESQKNYEDIDTDFIDLCFDVLSIKQDRKPFNIKNVNKKVNKIKVKKILLVAAVFMIFIATTLTVSASVFHFNIPKEISSWIKGDAKTDINLKLADTTADGYLLEDSDLANKLEAQGLSPITFPEELIKENSEIIKIDNITTDSTISLDIYIEFNYNNAFGTLAVSQYSENFEWTGEMVDMDVLSAEMIKVNGMDVLIFEQTNGCTIQYKDNLTEYSIYLKSDIKSAIQFAKSIK